MQPITPDMVEGAYVYLLTTLPFRRWKLPHPDKIIFRIMVTRERYGHWFAYVNADEVGELAVSQGMIGHTCMLTRVVAHEMVHIEQERRGHRDKHGEHFQRLAKLVCRHHGWTLHDF